MEFVIIYDNSKRFQFPVNPETVEIQSGRDYREVYVLELGEISIPQGYKSSSISFESFFPKYYEPDFCEYIDIPDPIEAVELINRLMNEEIPVRFLITKTWVNIPVTIRVFNKRFVAGEPDDIYFKIEFKYYRPVKIRTASPGTSPVELIKKESAASANKRPDLKQTPKSYTVTAGDSLWAIAKKLLGNGSKWKDIYELNKNVIGKNPNLIKPGQKFVLPG